MRSNYDAAHEWLEPDGLGGFASGTASGIRTRRYHALLLSSEDGPSGRRVLVNGIDAFVHTGANVFALSAQYYQPGVIAPDGAERIQNFTWEPWPRWVFQIGEGILVSQEIFVPHELRATVLTWRLVTAAPNVILRVRPFLSGRDYHALHKENGAFRFDSRVAGEQVTWTPYQGVPAVHAFANAKYAQAPLWYRSFLYMIEQERGLDDTEDLGSPGEFTWNLSADGAALILAHPSAIESIRSKPHSITEVASAFAQDEQRRRAAFASPLHRAADAYVVSRSAGKTIIAGYPWFTDWARDTFVALRGLCIATARFADALEILLFWAGAVSEGMIPNRFPDQGPPEFNSVDASLWFIVAAYELLMAAERAHFTVPQEARATLENGIGTILDAYSRGTRYRIHMTEDGLLAAGEPGVPLTWMDVKIGDWVVTPRAGKPVEVQALWLNALWIGARLLNGRYSDVFAKGQDSFRRCFWSAERGCLYDVVDVDHETGRLDASLRPNQIFAVGGLPLVLFEGEQARQVVSTVEQHLLTPVGLRTLAPDDPAYVPRYIGNVRARDSGYHQGAVWPWLLGAFVAAWVRVNGANAAARKRARERFLPPISHHLNEAGLGHISEIFDAEPPHTPRGCPWQAWSLGEFLRLDFGVLADEA